MQVQPLLSVENLPFLTGNLPGIGGQIKKFNDDFVVEEIPLYPPCGSGTHIYFTVEKQGLTTPALIRMIAQALGRPSRDVGYAGMKDAHGITRQMLSIEHVDPAQVQKLALSRVSILSVDRHTNKLKLGHLAGNRFELRIRDAHKGGAESALALLSVLAQRGVPNYFGPQRFGARGDNAQIGRAVLLEDFETAIALILGRPGSFDRADVLRAREAFEAGDFRTAMASWPRAFPEQIRVAKEMVRTGGDARRAWRAVDHTLRKLYTSAFQSELFNQIVAKRITEIDQLMDGDMAWKHANGACFHVETASVEQPRCDAFEISPTGPLFGPRMTEPKGRPGLFETEVLADAGLTRDQVRAGYSVKLEGARRPIRAPLRNWSAEAGSDERGPFVSVAFTLPAGAYATCVTRELCRALEDRRLAEKSAG